MKRFFAVFLSAALCFSLAAPVYAVVDESLTGIATPVVNTAPSCPEEWPNWVKLSAAYGVENEFLSKMVSLKAGYGWGQVSSLEELSNIASRCQNSINSILRSTSVGAFTACRLKVTYDVSNGIYRIIDDVRGYWFCYSDGSYPYYGEGKYEFTYVREDKVGSNIHIMTDAAALSHIIYVAQQEDTASNPCPLTLGTYADYYVSAYRADQLEDGKRFILCDASGAPLVYIDADAAVNLPQDYYNTDSGNGQYTSGDTVSQQLIDLINGVLSTPNGDSYTVGDVYYDMSNKTYHVDAHTEYNIENNYYYTYNFSYTYHINYTSVTYIGTTAEYDKTYEYYYQLPDGRSSADLTVEELQALNTNIDVLPYLRSADDTAIRALYHFDGDTNDSSYWSYAGEFIWDEGASITYMDAGTFEGALYLDENAHKFHIKLPSNLGSSDFTIQFRYYQSSTLTPVFDSSISLGSLTLCSLTGDAIAFKGTAHQISVGNWQELCFMRSGNTLYCYHNGVVLGSMPVTGAYGDTLTFVFGNEQQTYKYFDELRVVSKALYSGSYTPTSVPYDTNLALVLPDSQLPVADAYWDIKSSKTNLLSQYKLDNWINVATSDLTGLDLSYSGEWHYYSSSWRYGSNYTSTSVSKWSISPDNYFYMFPSLTSLFSSASGSYLSGSTYVNNSTTLPSDMISGKTYNTVPTYGIWCPINYCWSSKASDINWYLFFSPGKTYTLSMVASDGSIGSFVFTTSNFYNTSGTMASYQFNGYTFSILVPYVNGGNERFSYLSIRPTILDAPGGEFVYLELVEGDSTDLTAEYVESVVVMDKDDLNTPSLAVRTDLDITGYQIGGVRPSLPTKGLVWALVEDGMITSLQIYNGQAWESVDGRIWTGSRWVPYYAYDVILLKDLYDVVESDPSLDYIYTESGFWKWLQSAWAQMMSKLDAIHVTISGLGTASGGSGSSGTINPDPEDPDFPDSEDGSGEKWSIVQLFGGVVDGVWVITTGVVNTCVDGVSGLVDTVGSAGDFFAAYRVSDGSDDDLFGMFTYEGSDIWD